MTEETRLALVAFPAWLAQEGYAPTTIHTYRAYATKLLATIPEDQLVLTHEDLEGRAPSTIAMVSAAWRAWHRYRGRAAPPRRPRDPYTHREKRQIRPTRRLHHFGLWLKQEGWSEGEVHRFVSDARSVLGAVDPHDPIALAGYLDTRSPSWQSRAGRALRLLSAYLESRNAPPIAVPGTTAVRRMPAPVSAAIATVADLLSLSPRRLAALTVGELILRDGAILCDGRTYRGISVDAIRLLVGWGDGGEPGVRWTATSFEAIPVDRPLVPAIPRAPVGPGSAAITDEIRRGRRLELPELAKLDSLEAPDWDLDAGSFDLPGEPENTAETPEV